jgi:trimeric autotransporter adhesin
MSQMGGDPGAPSAAVATRFVGAVAPPTAAGYPGAPLAAVGTVAGATTTTGSSTPAVAGMAWVPNTKSGSAPVTWTASRFGATSGGSGFAGGNVAWGMGGTGIAGAGSSGGSSPVGGSGPIVAPTPPTLSAQAKTDLQTLGSDIQAIEAKSQVTVAELTAFRADLQAVAKPSGQPSSAVETALQTLHGDESAVLTSGTFTSAQQAQLVSDVAAVLTAEGATQAQANQASTDLQAIITSSGITSADIAQIATDVKAIQADLGTSGSSTNSSSSAATSSSSPTPNGFGSGLLASLVLGRPGGPMGMGTGGGAQGMSPMLSASSSGGMSTAASSTSS